MEKGSCIYVGSDCYRLLEKPNENRRSHFATWSVSAIRNSNEKIYFLKFADKDDKEAIQILRREGSFQMYYTYIEHVYGAGLGKDDEGNSLYVVVSEYIEGKNLKEYMGSGAVDEEKMFRGMMQLLRGVRYYINFEKRDPYVHRDLKPENIMVSDRLNKIFIIDFDWAHIPDSTKTQYGNFYIGGTRGYMDPRAGKTRKTDIKMDIYSLGRIFCFWMIGKDYFDEDECFDYLDPKHSKLAYSLYMNRFPEKYRHEKYKKLMQIIRKMVAPETQRYQDITDILSDMKKFLKEYCGGRKEFQRVFFENSLLEYPEDQQGAVAGVSYKIKKNGEEQGGRLSISLENYRMHDIEIERKPVMSVYNLDGTIFYIPFRKNLRAKEESGRFIIEDSMTFQYGDYTISFL